MIDTMRCDHTFCFLHLRKAFERKLTELGLPQVERSIVVNEILGVPDRKGVVVKGLAQVELEQEFWTNLATAEQSWAIEFNNYF